ncbi:MAG: TIGR00282 family metallophosphoesterase [bacterium]|nr:TIGR00282 family metallophosphoesterase [bacterium]
MFNVLFLGDIVGNPGRNVAKRMLPQLKRQFGINFTIANAENAAGGTGLTEPVAKELFDIGIDLLTGGNHIWDKKEIFSFIDESPRIVRPLNYPDGTPGRGYYSTEVGQPLTPFVVINVCGRTFMPPVDCPFRAIDRLLKDIDPRAIIFVDFHAEATSEKLALAYHLDGKVAGIVGTHTHVQTADERILPKGTAYLSDAGMCGPYNSILGVEATPVVNRFLTGLPTKFTVAEGDAILSGVVYRFDLSTRKAVSAPERIRVVQ